MVEITHFADPDCGSWDQETGMPTCSYFGNAVQVWATAQGRDATIAGAALTFNVTPELIRAAIEDHPWMYVGAGDTIEHDGE